VGKKNEVGMSSWYKTGYDGIGQEEQRLAQLGGPPRLWMPVSSTREVVFVDSEPIAIYEHNWKANGSWKNWATCLRGIEDSCPGCEVLGENNRYYVGIYTVVDTSEWTDRRGNSHQFEINLLPAKLKTLKKFRRKNAERIEAGGTGLAGCLYRLARDSKEDSSVGGEAEYVRDVDMAKLFQLALYKGKKLSELMDKADQSEDSLKILQRLFQVEVVDGKIERKLVPINYEQQLHPLTIKDFKEVLGGAEKDDDKGGGARADDKVPF